MNTPNPARAHAHTSHHRQEILASKLCGCCYCSNTFAPALITDWWDAPPGTPEELSQELGETATCPYCGIDAVLGSASGLPITPEFLVLVRLSCF